MCYVCPLIVCLSGDRSGNRVLSSKPNFTPVILVQLTRRATTNATQFVDVTDIFEVSKRFIFVLFGYFLESNFGENLHS